MGRATGSGSPADCRKQTAGVSAQCWGQGPTLPLPFTTPTGYLGPADEANRAEARSELLQGLQTCLDDLRVSAQAQVVVGTEVKDA